MKVNRFQLFFNFILFHFLAGFLFNPQPLSGKVSPRDIRWAGSLRKEYFNLKLPAKVLHRDWLKKSYRNWLSKRGGIPAEPGKKEEELLFQKTLQEFAKEKTSLETLVEKVGNPPPSLSKDSHFFQRVEKKYQKLNSIHAEKTAEKIEKLKSKRGKFLNR